MKTRKIAGHSITLKTGTRYIATRPIATRARMSYPVAITEAGKTEPALTIDLTYKNANALLNAFNNGEMSFDGRVW